MLLWHNQNPPMNNDRSFNVIHAPETDTLPLQKKKWNKLIDIHIFSRSHPAVAFKLLKIDCYMVRRWPLLCYDFLLVVQLH